jgi:hypothetical protein
LKAICLHRNVNERNIEPFRQQKGPVVPGDIGIGWLPFGPICTNEVLTFAIASPLHWSPVATVIPPAVAPNAKDNLKQMSLGKYEHKGRYAMLISQVRTELVVAGFDPSIGFAHRRSWNPIPLVYDLMEPLRPIVDRKILEFALSSTFTPGDFTIARLGGCRLNPQFAKSLTKHVAGIQCRSVVESLVNQLTWP